MSRVELTAEGWAASEAAAALPAIAMGSVVTEGLAGSGGTAESERSDGSEGEMGWVIG